MMKIKLQTILFVMLLGLSTSEIILTVYSRNKLTSYRLKKECVNNFINKNNDLYLQNLDGVIGIYQKELNQTETNSKNKTIAIPTPSSAIEPEKIKVVKEIKPLKIVVQKIKND